MNVVNCYTGEGAPTDREKDILAHHRASGPDKTARAYNPDELHAPVAKWTKILHQRQEGAYTPRRMPTVLGKRPSCLTRLRQN